MDRSRMSNNSLHLTSTGVGHSFMGKSPDITLKSRLHKELPPSLLREYMPSSCRPLSLDDTYQTSTQLQNTYVERAVQAGGEVTSPPVHVQKKAPGSWKVTYILDNIDKLSRNTCRRPLTMGNQCSEMKGEYQGKSDQVASTLPLQVPGQCYNQDLLPQTLTHHFQNNLTKELPGATVNKKAKGRSVVVNDQAVLDRLQPYVTTQQWFHRTFPPKERLQYPCKDIATYWQCENYPKTRGFGLKYNPLDSEKKNDKEAVMRDRILFHRPTTIPSVPPQSLAPVSYGLRSLYSDKYQRPPTDKRKTLFSPLIPPTTTITKDESLLHTVPLMYKCTNSTYGDHHHPPADKLPLLMGN